MADGRKTAVGKRLAFFFEIRKDEIFHPLDERSGVLRPERVAVRELVFDPQSPALGLVHVHNSLGGKDRTQDQVAAHMRAESRLESIVERIDPPLRFAPVLLRLRRFLNDRLRVDPSELFGYCGDRSLDPLPVDLGPVTGVLCPVGEREYAAREEIRCQPTLAR